MMNEHIHEWKNTGDKAWVGETIGYIYICECGLFREVKFERYYEEKLKENL